MSDKAEQFPKRKIKGGLEVRHRAGTDAPQQKAEPLQIDRVVKKGADLEPQRHGSGRRRPEEEAAPPRFGMMIVAGIVLLGVVVVALWVTVLRGRGTPVKLEPVAPRKEEPRAEVSGFVMRSSPAQIAEAIETTVREFMNAKTHEERCRWVRGGEEMLAKMEDFYARPGNEPPGEFGEITDRSALPFGGVPAEVVTAQEAGSDEIHVFSVLPGRDRMVIDWESAVGYGEMSWSEFLEKRPLESIQMRVFVKLDNYYNYGFTDEQKWQSLRIKTREADEMLDAYVERDSETGRELLSLLGPSVVIPMNLRLKFLPETRERDMVVVEELIHPYWMADQGLELELEEE